MSGDNFLARFLNGQRAKGQASGPLFDMLEGMAGASTEAAASPTPHVVSDIRTVQDFMQERRPAPVLPSSTGETFHAPYGVSVDFARAKAADLPAPQVRYQVDACASLTACVEQADQPELAKAVYRLLFELALEVVRVQGCPTRPDVAVFHLPQELLVAHFGVHRSTMWRNLKPFLECGVLAERDHYDTLRGATAVSGKLWAVSLYPERVLSGQAAPVRITKADLAFNWRDLDKDARTGRTVWEITRTDEQKAQARAEYEASKQAEATGAGKAKKTRVTRGKSKAQQSVKSLKAVERAELEKWVLDPFFSDLDIPENVTLTVAGGVLSGKDAIFTLPTLAGLPKAQRGAAVEETARALARGFEDSKNLRFWCWLVWQTLRSYDQGEDLCDDIMFVLSRVLADLKHDESMYSRTLKAPAAAAVNLLRKCGLLEKLQAVKRYRVAGRPAPKAA